MNVSNDFVEDLNAVRDGLSHQIPDRNLEKVLRECLVHMLATIEKRQKGTGERYIPAAIRREVFQGDVGACTFVGVDGHRCGSRYMLEYHHIVPFARGGRSIVHNLTLHCRAHNQRQAELDYAMG